MGSSAMDGALHKQRQFRTFSVRIYFERLLHKVQNLVAQGGAAKIGSNKYLILKDRENHIFLDPLPSQGWLVQRAQ
uniref:Uncharacterized protein n=1 Tax=Candidatus Kentrum sp. LPFa TaxID=2126335 RepID=A0A450WMK3_9GAMM|nr:MAG: hypothetical protein BECKLPF1236A_GA0070988_101932 [Candidatus Kentron sp. LPFa]VFK32785.1 MAG: hypothetical protein BECKLPF1236C_GA0070990_101812 [Candidatus Kentron sp. LPFa]